MSSYDVIIIGAGLAGLKAALELADARKNILLLEARDRVGGRSMPGEIAGQTIDLGGQWASPLQTRLLDQAQQLGVMTYPQYTQGLSVLSLNGKLSRYASTIPKLPPLSLLELGLLERRWNKEMASLPANAQPWLAARAGEWDAESLESWILKHVHTQNAREFARTVARAVLCAETRQVSYLCFLEYLRQGKGLRSLTEVEGGAQQDKFIGGAWQIPQKMAAQLGDKVLLNHPVNAITQSDESVSVQSGSRQFSARRVIVAVPPLLASKIHYSPALPAKRMALAERMPMGSVIKIHIAYARPFWREAGFSGAAFSNDRIFNVIFDQSPPETDSSNLPGHSPGSSPGILVGFIDGDNAIAMSDRSEQERKQQVIDDLVHYFGPQAADAIDYVEQDWTQEQWSRGCYVAHTPPGVLTSFGEALRVPCGRIHWAGTETATEWTGYLEGALQSASRATDEILSAAD